MSDKILKESLDRIKAIEESDDPFCLNDIAEEQHIEENTEDDLHKLEEIEDAIEEFRAIQEEYAHLNERLKDAIRAYTPDSLRYWQSYGLAQLAIVTQGANSGFASHDESIDTLIEKLEDEYRTASASGDEFEEDVDKGVPTRKLRF